MVVMVLQLRRRLWDGPLDASSMAGVVRAVLRGRLLPLTCGMASSSGLSCRTQAVGRGLCESSRESSVAMGVLVGGGRQ